MLMKNQLVALRRFALPRTSLLLRPMSTSSGSGESYSERMMKTGRPVSPHVWSYAYPVAAISSITNRVTGVMLTCGVSGMGFLSLIGSDVGQIMMNIGNSGAGPLAKFSVAFPLVYHYFGGVRHMMWDFLPETVNNEQCATSSYVLGAAAIVTSSGLAFVSF